MRAADRRALHLEPATDSESATRKLHVERRPKTHQQKGHDDMAKEQTAGQRFAAKVRDEYDLGVAEELLLDELADAIDERRKATGDVARRGWAVIISRLVGQLNLPDLDTGSTSVAMSGTSRRAQRASVARWRREKGEV
jgi:hypothetical protein